MAADKQLIAFFKEIGKHDLATAGGKGANLGEMWNAGFPVPNGFAVTVESYERFLQENQLDKKIFDLLKVVDVNKADQLQRASKKIERLLTTSKMPDQVAHETIKAYKKLSGGVFAKARVAVRSSATAEDLPNASFAGQQATFLNVTGEAELLHKVRECWASLFTARAIFYRAENKIDHSKVKISVIVQKMIQSVVSGVMFSVDPVTTDKDRIIIEAVWGLGEMIVQGSVVPDRYVVQKDTFFILSKETSDQSIQLIRKGKGNQEVEVPKKIRGLQKVSDENIIKLAKLADKSQKHYYFPQDMEWAWDGKDVFITQTRPITTLNAKGKNQKSKSKEIRNAETPILTGISASPGIGTGHVKILKSPKEIGRVSLGDVLVAKMTSPDYVPAMKRAAAIITDEGGQTSHAAIVSRELGIPCVVGTRQATTLLKDGFLVSVDGAKGLVYLGSKVTTNVDEKAQKKEDLRTADLKTATKLYVNLAEPERAAEVSKMKVDGVGLLRAEFIIANIGIHPKEAIKQKKQVDFINKLAAKLELFCSNFDPRPVVYRATDFKTNEYRALPGGEKWEPVEPNPLMGFRGAFRYVSNPEVFHLELEAIKKVRLKYKNLALMIPYVHSPEELSKVRRLVASAGLFDSATFRFWMMVELPVNVIMLEDFLKVGVDGVSVGSNDLTMLLLGTDRDNSEVASAYDERSKAVSWALRRTARICAKYNVKCSICGQAPSTYDDLVEKLVKWGYTSISVNPDAVARVRGVIHQAERKLIT